jgi:predicted RNase H-like HicB family nuclease
MGDRCCGYRYNDSDLRLLEDQKMKLSVVLEPSDEGGYTVYVPVLPGCISEGETVDEALVNIQEAIELYLEPVEQDFSAKEGFIVKELVL